MSFNLEHLMSSALLILHARPGMTFAADLMLDIARSRSVDSPVTAKDLMATFRLQNSQLQGPLLCEISTLVCNKLLQPCR